MEKDGKVSEAIWSLSCPGLQFTLMNERYEQLGRLNACQKEIEEQLRYVVCLRKVKGFGQKMTPVLKKFDLAFKGVGKTLAFDREQKPIALQDFIVKFNEKVAKRKEHFLNRYSREIEQLKSRFDALSKRIQAHTVTFCDDVQLHQQRFKRQVTVRKQIHEEAVEKLQQGRSTGNQVDVERLFNERLEEEVKRLNTTYEAELKTKQQTLDHIRAEIEAVEESSDEACLARVIEAHRQEMEFLGHQKEDQLSMYKKQKDAILWNMRSLKERIASMKAASARLEQNYADHVQRLKYEVESQNAWIMLENHDKAKNIHAKIVSLTSSLQNKVNNMAGSVENQIKQEQEQRQVLIDDIRASKQTEFQQLLTDKRRHLEILKREVSDIQQELASLLERKKQDAVARKAEIEEENKVELNSIRAEMASMYEEIRALAPSPEIKARLDKVIGLFREIDNKKLRIASPTYKPDVLELFEAESSRELDLHAKQMTDINGHLLQIYELSMLAGYCHLLLQNADLDAVQLGIVLRNLKMQIRRLKRIEMAKAAYICQCSPLLDATSLSGKSESSDRLLLHELTFNLRQERQLQEIVDKDRDELSAIELKTEIAFLEKSIARLESSRIKRNTPLPPLHS